VTLKAPRKLPVLNPWPGRRVEFRNRRFHLGFHRGRIAMALQTELLHGMAFMNRTTCFHSLP